MATDNVSQMNLLEPLLPWLNGEATDPATVGDLLVGFAFRRFSALAHRDLLLPTPDRFGGPRALAALRRSALRLLERAVVQPGNRWVGEDEVRMPSLRFTLWRTRERPTKMPRGREARRRVNGGGAFRVVVRGRFRDLVLYALARVLTEPGGIEFARCPAPSPNDWARPCGRYFISGRKPGRPALFCSNGCRVRSFKKQENDARRKGAKQ